MRTVMDSKRGNSGVDAWGVVHDRRVAGRSGGRRGGRGGGRVGPHLRPPPAPGRIRRRPARARRNCTLQETWSHFVEVYPKMKRFEGGPFRRWFQLSRGNQSNGKWFTGRVTKIKVRGGRQERGRGAGRAGAGRAGAGCARTLWQP